MINKKYIKSKLSFKGELKDGDIITESPNYYVHFGILKNGVIFPYLDLKYPDGTYFQENLEPVKLSEISNTQKLEVITNMDEVLNELKDNKSVEFKLYN